MQCNTQLVNLNNFFILLAGICLFLDVKNVVPKRTYLPVQVKFIIEFYMIKLVCFMRPPFPQKLVTWRLPCSRKIYRVFSAKGHQGSLGQTLASKNTLDIIEK